MSPASGIGSSLGPNPRQIWGRLGLYVLVGLVAGIGAIAFYYMLEGTQFVCLSMLAGYSPPHPKHEPGLFSGAGQPIPERRWLLLILPAIGGLVSGWLVFKFAPEAEGHGTDAAIEAYHFKGGLVRARVPLIKTIASAITIGTGGSGGREGPIAQVGSGFGSVLAQLLRLSPHDRRLLMAAGMGAGIGAIFHAPLAGALFAAEVMYRELDLEHEVLVPAFVASIVSYSVFGSVFGFQPLFATPDYHFNHPLQLFPYLLLALVCAGGAAMYVTAFYGARERILVRMRIPNYLKPVVGGLLVGLIGFFLPEALSTGYSAVQACFESQVNSPAGGIVHLPTWSYVSGLFGQDAGLAAIALLALIAVAKIATTALSIGSGGSGGVFGPAVVIGAVLGGATGLLCQRLFPNLGIEPGAFALVGMGGFFAAAAKTPISTMIMVSEMTGNYNLLVPSMLVCILGYVLCRRFNLYQKQLPSHFHAPSQIGNMANAVLGQLTVGQTLRAKGETPVQTVLQSTNLKAILKQYAHTTQACLPVVDGQQRLTGVIDTRDLRRVIGEVGLEEIIIARDVELPPVVLQATDTLLTAIRRMVASNHNELVVVDAEDRRKVIGTLSRADVVAEYERQLQADIPAPALIRRAAAEPHP